MNKEKTIQDYQEENETLKKINAALMEGKPSGLNVHQARMLLGELEAENKRLKKTLEEKTGLNFYQARGLAAGLTIENQRLKNALEKKAERGTLTVCHDCGALSGEPHKDGCDVELCSVCGEQRLQCDCEGHDPLFARWTGIWPGMAEAQFLGMDLNTLFSSGLYKFFFIKPGK